MENAMSAYQSFALFAAILLPAAWMLGCAAAKGSAAATFGRLLPAGGLGALIRLPAILLRKWRYEPRLSYDRKISVRIVEYYGKQDSELRFLLHQATKISFMAAAAEFCLLVGAASVPDGGYMAFCAIAMGAAFIFPDSRLSRDIKRRRLEMMLDFPDFLVKLTLLINAGMNVTSAWEKVAGGTDGSRALGRELTMAMLEIRAGKSEFKAYEDFAKRCRMQEVTRVVSVLLQNVKKGNAELVSILRVHANECWEMRKNAAKKLGEEASSKMLLPMAIMLLSILLIVTTPAILALQGAV
ncbi:MAG: type II secretion system F family protein [Clostridiales bacterium]|jgi:tight adherence protein C|nr:type II secretion system F family protein [Clostridiales bacterium]